jgi:hypothetical protein
MGASLERRTLVRDVEAAASCRRKPGRGLAGAALVLALLSGQVSAKQISDLQAGRNFPLAFGEFGAGCSENIDPGDVDNDGDLDVIVANGGDCGAQPNRIFINQGNLQGGTLGTFAEGTAARFTGIPHDRSRDIEFVDFDADADLDIFVSNSGTLATGGEVSRFYLNQGGVQTGTIGYFVEDTDARWGDLVSVPAGDQVFGGDVGSWRGYSCDCDFADLDDDGDTDLFHSTYGPDINGAHSSRVFLNDGTGVFDEAWPWVAAGGDISLATIDVDLVDLDLDCDIDVIASDRAGQARIYRNNLSDGVPGPLFTEITQAALINTGAGGSGAQNYETEYADLDGDGDFDAWMTNYDGYSERILRNDGGLSFTEMPAWILGDPVVDENEADVIDFDGDGDLDTIMANFSGANTLYQSEVAQTAGVGFHATGTSSGGSQAPWPELPSTGNGGTTLDADAADVDGDGDEDLLLANGSNQNNRLLMNTLGIPDVHAPTFVFVEVQGDKSAGCATVLHAKIRDNSSHYLTQYYATNLIYDVDSTGDVSIPMFAQGSMQFRAVIPGQVDATVSYRVETTDLAGNTTVSPSHSFLQSGVVPDSCECPDNLEAELDGNGDVIFPPGTDMSTVVYEDVDQDLGFVDELYPDYDTTTDLWYPDFPCAEPLGGELPDVDLQQDLIDAGILGVTPEDAVAAILDWEISIAAKESLTPPTWPSIFSPQVTHDYTPPASPHGPTPDKCYILGGADLVFVHGLDYGHILDKALGKPGAQQEWTNPTAYPGSLENKQFYKGGYYKKKAKKYWKEHIEKYLEERHISNRYLVVSYACSERVEVAASAILSQIADAMHEGTGVVDPLNPIGPHEAFGTPSFVVISHSTGGPVTDVAMAAADQFPNLNAEFIPGHCKAHIGLHSATSGSRWATVAMVVAGYLPPSVPDWACQIKVKIINELFDTTLPCPFLWPDLKNSVLLDLVPLVMQANWSGLIDSTPVRTVTIAGSHPSYLTPMKFLWSDGFDDGVLGVNSQVGNSNPASFWPSGYIPYIPPPFAWIWGYDMGVSKLSTARAVGIFLDQYIDPLLNVLTPPVYSAGGAVPRLSPVGMLQRSGTYLGGSFYDVRNRYDNHFSFLLSSSDHSASKSKADHPDYRDTFSSKRNFEETRVISDPDIYTPYETDMPYPGDDAPLLESAPRVKHVMKGKYVKFKLFWKTYKFWLWKRHYFVLEGQESRHEMDFAYQYLLQDPSLPLECPPDGWDDIGGGQGGDLDEPILYGVGDLLPASLTQVNLFNAQPSSIAGLFLSLGPITPVPFKGGTLTVFPFLDPITILTTDPAGQILVPFPWPAGFPSGSNVFMQYAVQDATAPGGVAMSNALQATTP